MSGKAQARAPFIGPLLENTLMIPLTRGQYASVDSNDYADLAQYNWYITGGYACRSLPRVNGKKHSESMHQRITGFQWSQVDHINHNTIDNRRSNLRDGTLHNRKNRFPQGGTSQYHGVSWYPKYQKWVVKIMVQGERVHLGYFDDEVDAAQAYDEASLLHHKEYGTRNFS